MTDSEALGVPAHLLCCPTCGRRFEDLKLHSDLEDITVTWFATGIKPSTPPWYLRCPIRHKWTVKTIWRSPGESDLVQLDKYLGTDN